MHLRKHFAFLTFLITAIFATSAAPAGARAQQNGLGIAAVINDDVISVLDLRTRTTMIIQTSNMTNTEETHARIAPQVLRGLIDEKLMLQEARRAGIEVDQGEIDEGVMRIANSNQMSLDQLTAKMNAMNVPLSALTARIEAEISWRHFVGRTLARKIKIGEEEISDEIKRVQTNAGKPEYLLAEIFLPVDRPSQTSEVEQLATRLVQQMKAGAPFNALATNFSRAPSAAKAGDMGWVQASHLDPQLLSVIRNMQPGNVTVPVRTLGGYYIIMLRDVRTSPGLGSGDSTLKLTQLHMQATSPDGINQLAGTLTNMTRGVTNCTQLEALGAQSGSPLSGSLGEVTLAAMPDNMRTVLEALPVGQPSAPVATGGGLAVMMVCARQNAELDMESVRAEISLRLKNERLNVSAQRHLRDLRRMAFMDIRQ